MSDIVERLRGLRTYRREYGHGLNFAVEGDDVDTALADAIAEITRLRDALRELCDSIEREEELNGSISGVLMSDMREARTALEQSPKD